jgi:hypothetical protein
VHTPQATRHPDIFTPSLSLFRRALVLARREARRTPLWLGPSSRWRRRVWISIALTLALKASTLFFKAFTFLL